jgi:hypothetical protein
MFGTNLLVAGADPKTVQELLGHQTLEMTMKIYSKIQTQTKRQALAKLTYGSGTLVPGQAVQYPTGDGFSVQFGHQSVTKGNERIAN